MAEDLLEDKLREEGLDTKYWGDVLKTVLSVTNSKQLKHMRISDFDNLRGSVRYGWEESALMALFGISQGSYEKKKLEKKTEGINQQEDAKKLLKELKDMRDIGKGRNDELVRATEEQMKSVLSISDDNWKGKYENVSFEKMISNLSYVIGESQKVSDVRKNLSPIEVVKNASGGKVLKGILITGDRSNPFELCKGVLTAPNITEFLGSSMDSIDQILEFSSKSQHDKYHHLLKTMGYNVAANVKAGGWGLHLEAGYAKRKDEENQGKAVHNSRHVFQSRVLHCIIPMKSIVLHCQQLKLADEALGELKKLDQLIGTSLHDVARTSCQEFLKNFGSHIGTGAVHFGGIYECSAVYFSEHDSLSSDVRDIVRDAHRKFLNISCQGLGYAGGIDVNEEDVKSKSVVSKDYDISEVNKVAMKITKTGGSSEATTLPLWKTGLQMNETWAVINRGNDFPKDFTGIWELIFNHSEEFESADLLAETLKNTWLNMSELGDTMSLSYNKPTLAPKRGQNVLQKIKEWKREGNLANRAVEYLKNIIVEIRNLYSETGGEQFWIRIVERDQIMSDFLFQFVEMEDKFDSTKIEMIRYYLKQILSTMTGANFVHKYELMRWTYPEMEPEYIPAILAEYHISDVPSLIVAFKEKLLVELVTRKTTETWNSSLSSESEYSPNIKCTLDATLAVDHLKKHLESSEDYFQLFLLKMILKPLAYSFRIKSFGSNFTQSKLQQFVEKAEDIMKEYEAHKIMGTVPLQSFLFCLSKDMLTWDRNPSQRKKQLEDRIQDMSEYIDPQVMSVLSRYVLESEYEWEQLFVEMEKLSNGETLSPELANVDIPGLTWGTNDEAQSRQLNMECTQLEFNLKAPDMLKCLGLADWYPTKLSLQDVMKVKKDLSEKDVRLSDLPWIILKKLIMINRNARDNEICNLLRRTKDTQAQIDILDDIDAILKQIDGSSSSLPELSPLDVLITIYECCNLMLRQILTQKMFMCRLAVPLIHPQMNKNNLTFSMWALRTLVVEWKTSKTAAHETQIANTQLSNVSFLRYGRPSLSKSKCLNSVLGSENDTFFNVDRPLGDVERIIANGLVEAAWFIPSNKQTDPFQEIVMFLNLRGDAVEHEKQLQIIGMMSSIVVVFMLAESLKDHKLQKMMETVQSSDAKVIFVMQLAGFKDLKPALETYKGTIGDNYWKNTKFLLTSTMDREKNADDMKREIQIKISDSLKEQNKRLSLNKIALSVDIAVDEMNDHCRNGIKIANEVIKEMDKKPLDLCKDEMLPLQGESWSEWNNLQRQSRRSIQKGPTSTSNERDKLLQTMTSLRRKQATALHKLSPLIRNFVKVLNQVHIKPYCAEFCLQWLKMYLDNQSRDLLPLLRKTYHEAKTNLKLAKPQDEVKTQVLLQAETKLVNSSFGVEHLFREVGQIYEAIIESKMRISSDTEYNVKQLPTVMATLFLKGYPLELMDGDTSCVPMTWIKAVFTAIIDLIGDKKVFVISTLGLQSSGKSTMLNTMFGLQFAVSAGRCTRGVYVQSIQVDREADTDFDYVFVVDTEGLGALELGQKKHEHDNELATLVTGLGDVTIINIKGENVGEVQDVLQITVHAFLRMKLVSPSIKLNKKCVFLHQNVSAVDAKEKMAFGKEKMQDNLDEMVKEAASGENIADVNAFNDVINFDGQRHVWYIPDLWKGDPPMAPVNPGYSEVTSQVVGELLHELPREQESFMNISDVIIHFQDLWNGILADDFIFSFKNSLAVKAYNELDFAFSALAWNLEHPLSVWVESKASNTIRQCKMQDELDEVYNSLISELKSNISNRIIETKKKLEQYFTESNLKDIKFQWRAAKLNSLDIIAGDLEVKAKQKILSMKEEQRITLLQENKHGKHVEGIMKKAKHLADELKGQEPSEQVIATKFDQMWQEWMVEYGARETVESTCITSEIENLLYERLTKDRVFLSSELKKYPLKHPKLAKKYQTLRKSLNLQEITHHHMTIKQKFFEKIKFWTDKESELKKCRLHALHIAQKCFEEIDVSLKDIQRRDSNFNKVYAENLIKIIIDAVVEHNGGQETNFTLLPTFTVMLAVHVSHYALPIFEKMRKEYEEKHSTMSKLTAYKESVVKHFRNLVKQSTNEVISADILCDQIEMVMKDTVKTAIKGNIVDEVVRHFSCNKFTLITAMLDDMAQKDTFSNYRSYIHNPKLFALTWLTAFTNENVFSHEELKVRTYTDLAKSHINSIIRSLEESIEFATNTLQDYPRPSENKWAVLFRINLSHLCLSEHHFGEFTKRPISDYTNLQRLLLDRIGHMAKSVLTEFENETANRIKWGGDDTPYVQITDKLWGCDAQCPFCREPCQRSNPKHADQGNDSHRCIQHRPSGVGGNRWDQEPRKDKLVTETCNYQVQCKTVWFNCRDCNYQCRKTHHCNTSGTDWEYHKQTDYKTFLPEWDIPPSEKTDGGEYWKWFMCKFKHQLKEMYQSELPDIPGSWNFISKYEACASLRRYDG